MSNLETSHFNISAVDGKIGVDIDGTFGELVNLFANVMADNEDLKEVMISALMAVQMSEEDEVGGSEELLPGGIVGEA
jgi:hypothetical protein